MSLAAGSKLGPYEIQSPLGAGGVGEVYLKRYVPDQTICPKVRCALYVDFEPLLSLTQSDSIIALAKAKRRLVVP